ncbi:RNA-binding protein 25-like [Paramacrobiotus metropolitanus]|uniref:RNA-binding protein 25-like n=1 Tax=Paramacrobiotus metropolitanus TaxID=2943436 RepID=UPI0024463829|nr:RNA-binding protein 25-like [Paramacrobiotus metropolitanus]
MEAKRGNMDVFRNLISARNYGSIPVEERMLLEDRYREAIQNNESGWDETLEPLKCPQTDAYRKKFEEDQEKMRRQQLEDELRAKINAANQKASEQAAREVRPKPSSSTVPTASLNEEEAQLTRQSLIIQIDTLTSDPAAMQQELFDALLREKWRLQKGFAPAPYIKKAIEERMEDLRKSRQNESNVLQALRGFRRDDVFTRPRSPPHRERSRGHSREHERISERRSERSRERERTRDYRSERSRERSRDRDYRGGRGWVRHGNEITETSIQRKIDTAKILAATRGREEQRRAETYRTEPEKKGHQVPLEVGFRNRNVRMSTPERSWDKRREHTRNRTPDPQDKRWQERARYYAGFESGASKRSSSAEREDSPPKYQRMESTVHVVNPIVSAVQEDDTMEGPGSVAEAPAAQEDDMMEGLGSAAEASQDNVVHRRNVVLDSDPQPSTSTGIEPPQSRRREQESLREPDERREVGRRTTSRFNNRHPDTIDMIYEMRDTDEQKTEICRYMGIDDDSADANKIHTILNQLRHFLLDSGYAKEIKEGVEQGIFRQLYIPRDSARDCYLIIRRNGLHSLLDLNLLDVPLDTTDPIGMTQFCYRDYPERQEYVAQFVLRYVNPAFKLLAARASIGLQVDPKDHAARRMGQKVFAARLAHYKTHNQLVSNTMKDDIPLLFRPHVAKLGEPMEHVGIAHTARKALKKVQDTNGKRQSYTTPCLPGRREGK